MDLSAFRDPEIARGLIEAINATAADSAAGQDHGGVRHAHRRHREERPARRHARERHAALRPRLPGLRHRQRRHRHRDRARPAARRHRHHLRRHDEGPGQLLARLRARRPTAATSASSTPRSTRSRSPSKEPDKQVVFVAVGFETTAPLIAAAILRAQGAGPRRTSRVFSRAQDRARRARARSSTTPRSQIDAFILPGPRLDDHRPGALPLPRRGVRRPRRHHRLRAGRRAAGRLHARSSSSTRAAPRSRSRYHRGVMPEGNPHRAGARRAGLRADRRRLARHRRHPRHRPGHPRGVRRTTTPSKRVPVTPPEPKEIKGCQCGDVLRGITLPFECKLFAQGLHARAPDRPVHGLLGRHLRGLLPLHRLRRSRAPDARARRSPHALRPDPARARLRRHDDARAHRGGLRRRLRRRRAQAPRRRRLARRSPGRGSRSRPTPTSCTRSSSPAATSAGSRCAAPSTTSPRAAPRRSTSRVGFVLEEGFPVDDLGRILDLDARRRRARPACTSSPATRRSSRRATATASSSTPPASACSPRASTSPARYCKPGDKVLLSGTLGDHGIAIISTREGLDVRDRHRDRRRAAQRAHRQRARSRAGRALLPRPDARRPVLDAQRARGRLRRLDHRRRDRRARERRRCAARPRCSATTSSRSPTRARWSPIVPAEQAEAALAAMKASPYGEDAAIIGEVGEGRPARSTCTRASARRASWTCSSASSCRASASGPSHIAPFGGRPRWGGRCASRSENRLQIEITCEGIGEAYSLDLTPIREVLGKHERDVVEPRGCPELCVPVGQTVPKVPANRL